MNKKKTLSLSLLSISLALISVAAMSQTKTINLASALKAANTSLYSSDYNSKAEAYEAGLKVNEKICQEGMVLVKNENNVLPLVTKVGTQAKRVSVFGYNSIAPLGGASTEGDSSAGTVKLTSDIYSSLKDAGYVTNPTLKAAYTAWKADKKTSDFALVTDFEAKKADFEATYNSYGDAAIVVFTKGSDPANAHKLMLDQAQYDLLDYVGSKFDKVIVLINNSQPIELAKLQADANADSILIVGQPGDNGFNAVGQILSGEINPSGRLPDTYATDFKKAPSYNNYSDNFGNGTADLTGATGQYLKYIVDGTESATYLTDYEEGIYVGYRYYETRGYEETKKSASSTWYQDNVVYPFGYGLSYTDFSWEISPVKAEGTVTSTDKLKFNVKVTNEGDVAGKDVVEMYYTSPYTDGGIEKAYEVLGDFAKTDMLEPGKSQTVELSIDVKDMASYDYKTEKTYVLDSGEYDIHFNHSAHDTEKTLKYSVAAKTLINKSSTGYTITNQFDDVNKVVDQYQNVLSRHDLSQETTAPTDAERTLTAEQYKAWTATVDATYDTGKPWTATTAPAHADAATRPATAAVKLNDLIGKSYDDTLWDTLLDEMTLDEEATLINNGGFHSVSVDYIGKPYAHDTDGPKGWTGTGTSGSKFNAFAAEPVIAATWNKELAYEMGKIVGDQGIWGSSDRTDIADGGKIYGYSGWYAPAMNTHRSPFDGRYTEYYSEDGVLAGQMAANASLGVKSKGGYVFIKHFALHDDGGGVSGYYDAAKQTYVINGYRGSSGDAASGLSTWCNEQAMREIYFKPFQIAVEKGGAMAAMSAFNRLGTTWCGGSYALLTNILRNEWGFKGEVVTDIAIYGFLNVDQMIRAGNDFLLNAGSAIKVCANDYTKAYPATQVAAMRQATKNILYTCANSNAMQIPQNAAVIYGDATVTEGKVGTAYTADLATASLNTMHAYSEIKYAVTGGALPDGLVLSDAGQLTGTPTADGTFVFAVTASADGYASTEKAFVITIAPTTVPTDPVDTLSNQVSSVETEVSGVKTDVSNLASDVSGVKTDVSGVKTDVSDVKTDVAATKADVASLKKLGTAALIVSIVAAIIGVAAIVLNFFKKK
jgi:beta-glucosidase